MLGFILHGGRKAAENFCKDVRLSKNWTSLGDVKTLVHKPYKEDKTAGIAQNYIRVSVGIEGIEDILNDFNQALAES